MKDVQKRKTTIIQVNNFYKVTEVIILKSQSVDCLDLEQTYQLQHLDFRALLWTHLLLLLECGWALVVQEGPQQAVRTNFWEGAWVAVALRKKLLVCFFFFSLTALAAVQWSVLSCRQMEDVISCWGSVCCSK